MKPLSSFLLFGVLLLILSQPGFGAILDVWRGPISLSPCREPASWVCLLRALNFYYITVAAHAGTSSTGV
jgi:hypothetical protein